ncbi:diguanylate cyclase domain-containing protein [Agrobacterium rosae]|uniref:sensor domain-containing diguanylate cyclase n=1 Tax=Agrobacterium rosae TaxID=1972867 RepID=UPI003B9DD7BE
MNANVKLASTLASEADMHSSPERATPFNMNEGVASPSEQFNHLQGLFEKSFKAARVGIWECSLPDETLTWTDTVFEFFDLPPQTPLTRADIVALYTPESREKLRAARNAAIQDGDGFTLDAQIITAKGNSRWIRITAIVERGEGRSIRIFGMKQDITAEKAMVDNIRRLTEIDTLTGLASRAKFESVLAAMCTGGTHVQYGLLLVDLDGFKAINDTLGHQMGDECLREAGSKLTKALPDAVVISRIGGDEFAVIHTCESAKRLQDLGKQVVDSLEWWWDPSSIKLKISASVGGTIIKKEAVPNDVFALADRALYSAKAGGKNSFELAIQHDFAVSAA